MRLSSRSSIGTDSIGMLFRLQLRVVDLFELVRNQGSIDVILAICLTGGPGEGRIERREALRMRRDQPLRQNLGLDLSGADSLAGIERADSPSSRLL